MPVIIVLSGVVGWDITAKELRAELVKAKGKDVEFHVNSPGGLVFAGIEIFNLIRDYKGHTEARITGLAASAASYIVLAADRVSAHENATFMIHNALALAIGNHNDMRKVANTLEGISNILAKAYARKTGKPIDEIKSMMDAETFLFGNEMLHEGFVDEVIEDEAEDKEDEHDKETAIMSARAMIESCRDMMKESDAANEDFNRAVAWFDNMSLLLEEPKAVTVEIENGIVKLSETEWPEDVYEAATPIELIEAPFPNEHACRVRDPGKFQKGSFRRISRKSEGKTLDIIIGRLKGKTTTTTQAFRYPKDEWSASEARKHCKDHDGKSFEPATGKATSDNGGCGGGT
jgi:ATP-dependent Clp endopeptidase proteolytic subunit ClpP